MACTHARTRISEPCDGPRKVPWALGAAALPGLRPRFVRPIKICPTRLCVIPCGRSQISFHARVVTPRGASARGAAVRHLAPSGALLRRHAGPATEICYLHRCKGPGHPRSGQQGLLRRRLSECLFQPPALSHPAFPLVATMACCCASRLTCRVAHPLRATDLDGPTAEAGRVDRGEDCGHAGRSTQRERATH
jgi:hypothetical protein